MAAPRLSYTSALAARFRDGHVHGQDPSAARRGRTAPRQQGRLEGEDSDQILHRLLTIEKQSRLVEQPKAPRISRRLLLE